jgi:hypothetical protein
MNGAMRRPGLLALLGFAGHFHLGHPDGELPDDDALRGQITRAIRELQPEVVLCPDPTAVFFGDGYYNHRDHRVSVPLVDGTCPPGYPIKAKVASHVYHVPGGSSYARTTPDRCYASGADAEADGFRAAKR